mgnify:CR=1 FL=1
MNIQNEESRQFDAFKQKTIASLQDKKAEEITTIDLRNLNNRLTDMFIICHGNSDKHVESIAENVEEQVHKAFREKPMVREGFENKEWILLDYFDFVIHVFKEDKRSFYALEELWGDGKVEKINHE